MHVGLLLLWYMWDYWCCDSKLLYNLYCNSWYYVTITLNDATNLKDMRGAYAGAAVQ